MKRVKTFAASPASLVDVAGRTPALSPPLFWRHLDLSLVLSSTMMITKLGRSSAWANDAVRKSSKLSSRFIVSSLLPKDVRTGKTVFDSFDVLLSWNRWIGPAHRADANDSSGTKAFQDHAHLHSNLNTAAAKWCVAIKLFHIDKPRLRALSGLRASSLGLRVRL